MTGKCDLASFNLKVTMPKFFKLSFLPLLALTTSALAYQFGLPTPPPPFDDHALMMKQLGIRSARPGYNGNDPAIYDESTANRYKDSMPELLKFQDGKAVTSASQWPARRKQILDLFQREVLGRVPNNAPKVTWEVTGISGGMSGGIPTVTKNLLGHVDNRSYPKLKIDIQAAYTVPANVKTPVPIMVEFGFGGAFGGFPGRPNPAKPWTQQAIEHGWGYGTIVPTSVQPDNAHVEQGVIGLCNKGGPRHPDDWGALRAWAWGFSRLIAYFEKDRQSMVDPKKVGIEGVSRYGKAALIAEAFDPRVAVAFVASSGAGGAKLYRHFFGEALENLAGGEFYWMAGNLIKYTGIDPLKTVADLPVDSHELIALCAPRPCFLSYGLVEKGDANWVDSHGSFMAGVLAGPAYKLLGKRDLGITDDYLSAKMPPVNQLIGGELAWRQHDGGHEATPNWPSFFEWVGQFITAPALPTDKTPLKTTASQPVPRTDRNSLIAHQQLVEKARKGGIDLYFVGDSITRRWGTSDAAWKANYENWKANFYGWNAGDFGWGADATQNILWRLKDGELAGVNPKVIVILAGTNNIGAGDKASEVVAGIHEILKTCQHLAPKAKIILTAVFPRNDNMAFLPVIQEVNEKLPKFADGKRVRFVNVNDRLSDKDGKLFPGMTIDNLHPTPKGFQVWADGLNPILLEWLGPRSTEDHAPPATGDPSQTPPAPRGGIRTR